MLVFTSPNIVGGRLGHALARKPYNQYTLIFTAGYGMAASRESAILNSTTPYSEKLETSAENRPLIWLDADVDRDERNLGPPGGMLKALLAAEPPVIRPTGRTKVIYASEGGEREVSEVEVLLSEEDLARVCFYCGAMETLSDDRFESCGGQAHESLYWCAPVSMINNSRIFIAHIYGSVYEKESN
jgi:hypothetical protein